MHSLMILPAQARGIAEAVEHLEPFLKAEDEMVHLHEWVNGTGIISVQLTKADRTYHVTRNGSMCETYKEAEKVYEGED